MSANPTADLDAPILETFETVPEYGPLRAAIAAEDWHSAERELSALPPSELSHALSLLAEVDSAEGLIEEAHRREPDSAVAATALAHRRIVLAWRARSNERAEHVTAEMFAAFGAELDRAERLLIATCARHPRFGPAWAARVTTARGLELGTSEAQRRLRRAEEAGDDFEAHLSMQQFLQPKWFGSVDEAAAFAHRVADAAPDASNAGALVAVHHIERWLESDDNGPAYIRSDSVVAELRAAAARSVLHPEHRLSPVGVVAHNAFLMAFWLAGLMTDAAAHQRAVGRRASEMPWAYFVKARERLAEAWTHVRKSAEGAS